MLRDRGTEPDRRPAGDRSQVGDHRDLGDRDPAGPPDPPPPPDPPAGFMADLASVAGYVLAVSYPVLALSTGVRGAYQLFFKPGGGGTETLGPALSALAALFYLAASVGFAYRRRWTWYFSVWALGLESLMTLVVGTLSFVIPEVIGRTVWGRFGADYGFFPLFQPLLGLVWLLWPVTVARYGVDPRWLPRRWYDPVD